MPEFEAIHEGLTGSFFDYDSASPIADCIVRWDKKYIDKREEVRLHVLMKLKILDSPISIRNNKN
jgi:hypothetical protein